MSKPEMGLTISDDELKRNIRINIRRNLPQFQPHEDQDKEVIICGGGPSLEDEFKELEELYKSGVKVVSTNGSHDWLMERGIRPSLHVMVDGREFNERFVRNPIPTCKYMIASQCHPKVFDNLKNSQVWIWHAQSSKKEVKILDEFYLKNWYPVVSGSTVVLRAMLLVRMLGFEKQHIFGFDSCILNGKHHPYPQQENEGDVYKTVKVNGVEFKCTAWQWSQYEDFLRFTKNLGSNFQLQIYGNGLIATKVRAKLWQLQLGNCTINLRNMSRMVPLTWIRTIFGCLFIRRRVTQAPRH